MKARIYLRIAKGRRGVKVAASAKPNYHPLTISAGWNERAVPTAMFGLDLDVPDAVLRQAEQVLAEVKVEDAVPAVQVDPVLVEAPGE